MSAQIDFLWVLLGTFVVSAIALTLALYIVYSNRRDMAAKAQELRIIQQKKEVEFRLHQAKRMSIIGALAGGMSYHLNSTLLAISTLTDMLKGARSEKAKMKQLSDMITQEIMRGLRVTDNLTQLAHPQQLALHPLPAGELVTSVLDRFRNRLPKPSIRLENDTQRDDIMILGDETLLQQALQNLLVNAADAMPDGGTLALRVSKRSRSVGDKEANEGTGDRDGQVVISVSDTGIGMDEETRSRVFEPFFSTKMRPDRLGIGLSFVYGIAKIHDGQIDIQSEKDKGTTALLSLPAVNAERLSEQPPESGEEGSVLNESLTLEERLQLIKGVVGKT